MNFSKAAFLFDGWDDTMIWSCLQGHMGTLTADSEDNPKSALIDIGDFCFFAGEPNASLFRGIKGSKLLASQSEPWEKLIEGYFGGRVNKILRYAIKKEPEVFDREKLTAFVNALDSRYELRLFDRKLFEMSQKERWSVDLCSQFRDHEDYARRGVGAAILHDGKLVAGASTYAVFDGGIEIQIDTKPEYRRKGLATVCGARLILECLDRDLYPGWDAHDLRSVALAEKLGYHLSHPYTTYELSDG